MNTGIKYYASSNGYKNSFLARTMVGRHCLFMFSCILYLCLFAFPDCSLAQSVGRGSGLKPKILKEEAVVILNSQEDAPLQNFTNFQDIDKSGSYFNNNKLNAIHQLEEKLESSGDINEQKDLLIKLDQHLGDYLKNFTVENFKRDSVLLFKAGQIKHLLGDTARALFFYELASKHYRHGNESKKTYNELKAPTNNNWIPIEEYYKLLELRKRIDTLVKPHKVFVSLGPMINSSFPDYAPYMHKTDSLLIFTSRREKEDLIDPFANNNEDLYYSYKDLISETWTLAEKLPSIINSRFNEGSACLAPDGVTLFFTRCNDLETGFGDCDIYEAIYDPSANDWKKINNLGPNINSSYWDSQPHISSDGEYIFFSSNRSGGFGLTDIYYSRKQANGEWAPAVNAGPMINTSREEVTPFLHSINQTLYFSSTGQLNSLGGFDIFKSRKFEHLWEPPKNLGPLVNTEGNEYYFSIDREGKTIFYSKSENVDEHVKQNFDLYSFPMPMEARPNATSTIEGVLIDSISGYPLVGTVMVIDLEEGIEVAPKEINDKGYFSFDLINNRRYRIYVMGDNFLTIKNDIILENDTSFQIFTQSFEQNKPIVFESLEFGSNRYKLKAKTKPKLDYIVKFLELYPMFNVEVEGHTDSDGPAEYNLKLSEQRAKMIATYILIQGSFPRSRVSFKGYGEMRPVVPNTSSENKRKNRRVEFKLTLRPEFDGDMLLPTKEELFYQKDDDFDEWKDEGEEEFWDIDKENNMLEGEFDLEKELEKDIYRNKLLKGDNN